MARTVPKGSHCLCTESIVSTEYVAALQAQRLVHGFLHASSRLGQYSESDGLWAEYFQSHIVQVGMHGPQGFLFAYCAESTGSQDFWSASRPSS